MSVTNLSEIEENYTVAILVAPYGAGKSVFTSELQKANFGNIKSHLTIAEERKPRGHKIKIEKEINSATFDNYADLVDYIDIKGEQKQCYGKIAKSVKEGVEEFFLITDTRKDVNGPWKLENIDWDKVSDSDRALYEFHDVEEFEKLIEDGEFDTNEFILGARRCYRLKDFDEVVRAGKKPFIEIEIDVIPNFVERFNKNGISFQIFNILPASSEWNHYGMKDRGDAKKSRDERMEVINQQIATFKYAKHILGTSKETELSPIVSGMIPSKSIRLAQTYGDLVSKGLVTELPLDARLFKNPSKKDDPRNGKFFRINSKGEFEELVGFAPTDSAHIAHIIKVMSDGIDPESEKNYKKEFRNEFLEIRQQSIIENFINEVEAKHANIAYNRSESQFDAGYENNGKMAWFEAFANSSLAETYRQAILSQVYGWDKLDEYWSGKLDSFRKQVKDQNLKQILEDSSVDFHYKLQIGEAVKQKMLELKEKVLNRENKRESSLELR